MAQHYARRDRDREYDAADSATEYAKLYQRAQRAARNGSSFSPPASPTYEFTRQRTWPGPGPNGGSSGSYEEREQRGGFPIPIRERDRERDRERERDWQPSSSPRTPRTAGMTSGSSIGGGSGGGSYGRRERSGLAESPRHDHEMRTSPQLRDRERERDRQREKERERDREREKERLRDRDVYRQRMRYACQGYVRRLREYLHPVLQNQQAMDHATDIFVKLDQDARYLTRSAGALLESLAAVADDQASSAEGGNGTGLDDPGTDDSEEATESSALEDSETAAESMDSESDSDSDDDAEQQFGGYGPDIPNFSRRPSLVNGSVVGGSGGRRRSSAGQRTNGGADHQRKGSGSTSTNNTASPPTFMSVAGFRPYALNKHPDSVNDRRKSFLALTQIISVTLLASLGVDTDGSGGGGRNGSRNGGSRLSTRGLLAELLRVLQPKDYRAYFRAAARVILLPDTGVVRSQPEEMALEALERQLLGTAKFVPGVGVGGTAAAPMMACLTYTSSNYGSITLYRLEMAPPSSGGSSDSWPRRITPVSAMTGVPKELLRRTARAMPPSRRTVLKMQSAGGEKDRDSKSTGGSKNTRLRWISLPADTVAAPGLGYSPNVDHTALSAGFCEALALTPEDLKIAAGTSANIVNATVPAMLAWLHVRAAYLTGLEFEGTEVQRGSSGSKDGGSTKEGKSSPSKDKDRHRDRGDRDRDRDRERDFDETGSTSTATAPQRARIRRIIRWKRGPAPMDHDGKDPCIVVLHPSRGDWVTAPVYWTDAKA